MSLRGCAGRCRLVRAVALCVACFTVLPAFCGVVSWACNWAGNIHAAAMKSTSPTRVSLFQFCFNCPRLSPLRQAIRKEQGAIRAWAASSCNEQEHVVPGFQGCL